MESLMIDRIKWRDWLFILGRIEPFEDASVKITLPRKDRLAIKANGESVEN